MGFCIQSAALFLLASSVLRGAAQSGSQERSTPTVEGPVHSYLSASPSPEALSTPSLDRQYALGSWAGLRNVLGRQGVVPTIILISDPFGNLHGGEQTGATAYNLIGLDIRVNTESFLGCKGGQFQIGGAVNFGNSLSSSYVGNGFPIQLADVAGTQPRLTYLSYTQTIAEDRVSFRVGRLTVNSVFGEEFLGSDYFKSLVSVGFDLVPQGLFLNASGASGYPHTTWGTRVRYAPTKRLYVQAAAYNADAHQLEGSQHGLDLSIHGPLFTIGEIGLKHYAHDQDLKPSRNIKTGGFYTGGTHYKVTDHVLEPVRGLFGFYALLDQQIVQYKVPEGTEKATAELSRWGDAEHQRHLGAFASVVLVPEARTNVVPYFFNLGLISYGLSAQRPRDFFGAGFAYGSISRGPVATSPVSSSGSGFLQMPPNEYTLEVTYGFAVKPGVLLQPDLQYIVHPKGISTIPNSLPTNAIVPNALAIGVNIIVNF